MTMMKRLLLLLVACTALLSSQAFPALSSLSRRQPKAAVATTTTTSKLQTATNGAIVVEQSRPNVERWQRSISVTASCVLTWFLAALTQLSTVQASSIVGILGCYLSPQPTAAFCGSFAGMSGQLLNVQDSLMLGILSAGVMELFTKYQLGVGKGGRLGTIAYLGNLLFFLGTVQGNVLRIVNPILKALPAATVGLTLAGGAALQLVRRRQTETATSTTTASTVLSNALKVAIMAVLLRAVPLTPQLRVSMASILASSLIVKASPGVVLPVALVGLVGSFLLPAYATSIYLGAFVGMTKLANFSYPQFAQASVFSAVLLSAGVFDGFGGKLGWLSFLSVLFGM